MWTLLVHCNPLECLYLTMEHHMTIAHFKHLKVNETSVFQKLSYLNQECLLYVPNRNEEWIVLFVLTIQAACSFSCLVLFRSNNLLYLLPLLKPLAHTNVQCARSSPLMFQPCSVTLSLLSVLYLCVIFNFCRTFSYQIQCSDSTWLEIQPHNNFFFQTNLYLWIPLKV